ncbi:hypothetical protein GQ44DRAFT_825138 [Phaeosphaeriaceae sp. PMI808]|nr:hypothetical protein GQ44DRAFT_825138 [Phaeosphaeriaceae sp. PMI808]
MATSRNQPSLAKSILRHNHYVKSLQGVGYSAHSQNPRYANDLFPRTNGDPTGGTPVHINPSQEVTLERLDHQANAMIRSPHDGVSSQFGSRDPPFQIPVSSPSSSSDVHVFCYGGLEIIVLAEFNKYAGKLVDGLIRSLKKPLIREVEEVWNVDMIHHADNLAIIHANIPKTRRENLDEDYGYPPVLVEKYGMVISGLFMRPLWTCKALNQDNQFLLDSYYSDLQFPDIVNLRRERCLLDQGRRCQHELY